MDNETISDGNSDITATKDLAMAGTSSSTSEHEFDDGNEKSYDYVLQISMIEEEKKMEKERVKREMKAEKKEMIERDKKEAKERQLKCLLELLSKSKVYSELLLKDMESNNTVKKSQDSRKRKMPSQLAEAAKRLCTNNNNKDASEGGMSQEQDPLISENNTYINDFGVKVSINQPKLLGGVLRDYQLDGLNWLKKLYENGMNGILGDEMGLGKTIQVIALICHLYEKGVKGPFLVIGPLSTLQNWIIDPPTRKEKRKLVETKVNVGGKKVYPVVITSYETVLSDATYFRNKQWKYVVVDEGHKLKNYKSKISRALFSMDAVSRLILTGTPLQNNMTELWSLLHFLLPDVFNDLHAFEAWFAVDNIETGNEQLVNELKENHIITTLHGILEPFLLRREKKNLDLSIPPKKELHIHCPITKTQYDLYKSILDESIVAAEKLLLKNAPVIPDNADGTKVKRICAGRNNFNLSEPQGQFLRQGSQLIKTDSDGRTYFMRIKLANAPMMLAQVVNHPYLVQRPTSYVGNLHDLNDLIKQSGKLTVLDQLLGKLKERNHKVLLFSTKTSLLNYVEDYMELKKYQYRRLDGTHHLNDRVVAISDFNTNPDIFVFLISTKAGGLGLNLTAADTVIFYDSDWNPQNDLQAQDRCHRIGQTKPVIVYRLVCPGTIDEKIVSRANAKRQLEKIVIQKGNFSGKATTKNLYDLEDLRDLLLGTIKQTSITTTNVISQEQWDILLDRENFES